MLVTSFSHRVLDNTIKPNSKCGKSILQGRVGHHDHNCLCSIGVDEGNGVRPTSRHEYYPNERTIHWKKNVSAGGLLGLLKATDYVLKTSSKFNWFDNSLRHWKQNMDIKDGWHQLTSIAIHVHEKNGQASHSTKDPRRTETSGDRIFGKDVLPILFSTLSLLKAWRRLELDGIEHQTIDERSFDKIKGWTRIPPT